MNPDSELQRRLDRMALSPADAAQVAGIGRTKLYASIASGELPSFKIGTRRLIRVEELDRWLRSFEAA